MDHAKKRCFYCNLKIIGGIIVFLILLSVFIVSCRFLHLAYGTSFWLGFFINGLVMPCTGLGTCMSPVILYIEIEAFRNQNRSQQEEERQRLIKSVTWDQIVRIGETNPETRTVVVQPPIRQCLQHYYYQTNPPISYQQSP